MALRIVLVNAPLRSLVRDLGVGRQLPLGLLMAGGALIDGGHQVTLIDAARKRRPMRDLVREIGWYQPDVVMTAHVGSTSAHPAAVRLLDELKNAMPSVVTVYGGVYPTCEYKSVLAQHPNVDVIVRGEGEVTVVDVAEAIEGGRDWSTVPSIAWRRGRQIVLNTSRPPIVDRDAQRIAWELIDDWDEYQAFGIGHATVVQLSRHRAAFRVSR